MELEEKKSIGQTLADLLQKIVDNLHNGNSNVTTDEFELITKTINKSTDKMELFGTAAAIKYLRVSRSYFYEYAKPRLKGTKRSGEKTILYAKKDLDEYRKNFME